MSDLSNAYKPIIVPVSENETLEQFRARWAQVDALSEKEKDLLSSDFTYGSILELSKLLMLPEKKIADVSRLVRSLVCEEIEKNSLDSVLRKIFTEAGEIGISKIKQTISQILSQKTQSEIAKENRKKMSLESALKEFEKIGEQLLSSGPLKLRVFPEMVRPSVKNWIADYRDHLGSGKHGTMERGSYLFHSENGKKLTSLERRKVAEVLKSLDEGTELAIDVQNQKIFFETRNLERAESERKKPQISFAKSDAAPSFSGTPASFSDKKSPDLNLPKKTQPIRQRAAASNAGPASTNPSFSGAQELYEIPKTQDPKPKTQNPKPRPWNPAENVRKRMAEENVSFGSFQISPSEKNEPEAPKGTLRFSSPQTLPVEKNQEEMKKPILKSSVPTQKNVYAPSASPIRRTEAAKPISSTPKPSFPTSSQTKRAPVSGASNNILSSAFATSEYQSSDELMERMRQLKKKQQGKTFSRAAYKISPIGYLDTDEDHIEYEKDDEGIKVKGNVVDLRK